MIEVGDAVVTLRDGRRLGYAVYGASDGLPILSCHGGLLCRLDASSADAAARDLGLCVISPDRPGVGLSDRHPGHSTLDWADDAEELVDRLGVERFACMGWSMGGQYAAAVSHRLTDRVTRAAIVAGCLPLDEPGRWRELNRVDLVLGRASIRSRTAGRALVFCARFGASRFERRNGLPERSMSQGLRQSSGVVDEYRAFFAPWGFRLEDINVPTEVWQGTADELVPPGWGAEIARRLPAGELIAVEDADHMIAITHRAQILRRLVETSSR